MVRLICMKTVSRFEPELGGGYLNIVMVIILHPGRSRGFVPFYLLVLGTTKNSLFIRTPYENHAHSTSGYPPHFFLRTSRI